MEGSCNNEEIFDELPIEIGETKKALHTLEMGRNWPIQQSLDLVFIHGDTVFVDLQTQKLDFRHAKETLGGFYEKVIIP